MIWREREKSRIRAVEMDNLRGLLDIRKMTRVLNGLIKEFGEVTNGWMKGLRKIVSNCSTLLKKCGMIGLLKGCLWESVSFSLAGWLLEKKKFKC